MTAYDHARWAMLAARAAGMDAYRGDAAALARDVETAAYHADRAAYYAARATGEGERDAAHRAAHHAATAATILTRYATTRGEIK